MEGKDKLILQTALKLFLEKGYEKTNLKDIIEITGGSYATIYKRFSNKNKLFLESLKLKRDESIGRFISFMNENKELKLEDFLNLFAIQYFNFFCNKERARYVKLVIARSYHDNTLQQLINKIDKNIIIKELAKIFELKIDKNVLSYFNGFSLANYYCSMIRADKFLDLFFGDENSLEYDDNEIKEHILKVNKAFFAIINSNY